MTDDLVTVLVIDDEKAIRRFLRAGLESSLCEIVEAEDGAEGIRLAATARPDIILLDLGLPDMEGADVAAKIREWSRTPIIVLSVREHERDKIKALDAGADDYLTKPFGIGELLARIRVARRHAAQASAATSEPVFLAGDLAVDFGRHSVKVRGKDVHLTPNEFNLLATLARYADKVVTHRQLLDEVWGPAYIEETQYLRVYMGQLRHKIELDPTRPRILTTEPGVGYRLRTE